jgi:hypothetical protein
MGLLNISTPQETTSSSEDRVPLETGQYVMEIVMAQIAKSKWPDKRKVKNPQTGEIEEIEEFNDKANIGWGLVGPLTPEQEALSYQVGQRVYETMPPWYGIGARGDSKFKVRIDTFKAQKLIDPNNIFIAGETDDPQKGDLIGIKQLVMVEKYRKTMGDNKGDWGNKILAVVALNSHTTTPTFAPKPVNLDDIEAAERKTRLEYLEQIYSGIDDPSWTTEQLVETAGDFANFLQHPDWITKKYSTRNAVQLRGDIKTMWGMIERHELATNPDKMPF